MEDVNCWCVENSKRTRVRSSVDNVPELLQSHDKTLMDGVANIVISTLAEDDMMNVEMTTKDLKYYINWVNKAARCERIDSNFGKSSTVAKVLSNSITYYREIVCEMKSQSVGNFIIVLF